MKDDLQLQMCSLYHLYFLAHCCPDYECLTMEGELISGMAYVVHTCTADIPMSITVKEFTGQIDRGWETGIQMQRNLIMKNIEVMT